MLSVLICAKNESRNLLDCIRSVSFADEIVVIDDYSNDGTVELAQGHGCRVIQRRMNGDWSAQRNFGIEQCKGDWVLVLDADERVSAELRNSIIDKFTNIYIDNLLLNSNEISKSIKRKLLYQLYFLEIKNNNKNNIVIINNFDAYLNSNEIITILNTINNLTNENNHFILTSTSNIFEYISQEHFTVYKYMNKLINLDTIDEAIKIYLLKKEYNEKENFDTFYQQNESLIHKQEIIDIKEKLLNIYPHCLSKILNCTSINIAPKKPKHITSEYIICENKDLQQLFVEICNFLVDIN